MGRDNYISLITKQLNNELSTTELGELNHWLSANSGGQNIVSEFQQVWNSISSYKASTTFDVDSAYEKFTNKYNIGAETAHNYAEKEVFSDKMRYLLAGLTLIILFLGGIFLASKLKPIDSAQSDQFANRGPNAVTIPLMDGATALLAPEATISFNKSQKTVSQFQGEGLFDLAQVDKADQMSFEIDAMKFEAGEAVFNINNASNNLSTELVKGNLSFELDGKQIELKEGEKFHFNKKDGSINHELAIASDKAGEAKAIIDPQAKLLSFNNTPLVDVFQALEIYYGVKVEILDSTIPDHHFTALNMRALSLDKCLTMIQHSIPMDIEKTGKNKLTVSNISK